MANTQSALKRIRSNNRKRIQNKIVRTSTRTAVKAARTELEGTDVTAARKAILAAVSELDRAAGKGVIHPNNASRRKSRLMKQLAQLEKTVKA